MSYFAFGSINSKERDTFLQKVEGMHACCDDSIHQSVIQNMLDEQNTERSGHIFMLVKEQGDDTSSKLISPFTVGVDGVCVSLQLINTWIDRTLASLPSGSLELYITEGYEPEFEELSPNNWKERVMEIVKKRGDVPSVHISFQASK
jgi:hypothetical protein